MKGLGAAKQKLGIGVHKDGKSDKLWLSQQTYMEKILMRFNMYIVKLVNIHLPFHCKLYSSLCPGNKEEKDCMSHASYANTVGKLMFVMRCSRLYISHAVGVVS
jgi:ATP-binding cassette subfamily B (MDR/TAP) protein 1